MRLVCKSSTCACHIMYVFLSNTAEIAVSLGDLIISITNMLCWKSFCPCGNSSKTRTKMTEKMWNIWMRGYQKKWLEYATEQNIPQNEIWLHAFQVEAVGNTATQLYCSLPVSIKILTGTSYEV